MTMQTDVKATKPLTSTGVFVDQTDANVGRCRVKAIFCVNSTSAGSVVIANGNGGTTVLTVNTPPIANAGITYMLLPGEGLLCENGPYGTVTNTTSTVLFYG